MTCALCYRPSNWFGWMEPRRPMTPIRKRWLFCSRRCLEVFITLRFGEPAMLNPVVMNTTALKACLNPLGQYLDAAGLNRPLADYSQDEVLALIDTLVVAYRDSMLSQYEAALRQERLLYEHRDPQHREQARGAAKHRDQERGNRHLLSTGGRA